MTYPRGRDTVQVYYTSHNVPLPKYNVPPSIHTMEKSLKTINDQIHDFMEYLDIEKGLSNKSQETYARFLKKFSGWLKSNDLITLKPHELTDKHIWDYRLSLSKTFHRTTKEPLARSTQNYYLIALRGLLAFFADRNILSLPSDKIKLIKEKKEKVIKFLTLDQLKKFLAAPNISNRAGLRDKAILETFFSTGLRVAELVSLSREQLKIDPNANELEIVIIGKGNRPRPIYFSKRALRWLEEYLKTRKDNEKALFISYKGPKNADKRLTTRSVETIVKKHALLAGIPNFTTPHTLRHSFATDLLSQGVDLRLVQEFLGHKNIATTQIYTHVTSKQLRDLHHKHHSLSEEE